MLNLLKKLHSDESGQDVIEYILVAAIITVASIGAISNVGSHVSTMWNNLYNNIQNH
jgi:pilus assembly protein Flp/PilA